MKLKEIFDQLTYGELSQLSIGGGEAGVINAANYDRVLAHVNLGLTALYKRFPLREGRIRVELVLGRTEYPLQSKYAVSSKTSRETLRFIKDTTASPFRDDIHKIERVYGAGGFEYKLNDLDDPLALATPAAAVLRVPGILLDPPFDFPDEMKTTTLDVVYRANHVPIVTDDGDLEPELVDVDLPYSHLEPLLLFVASRVHTPTGMTNEANLGNTYMQKYEMACQQIELLNLRVDQTGQADRLRLKGFV